MSLRLENPESIGFLEEEWNSFDKLEAETKLLHNTVRLTQPWKAGLPIDFSQNKETSTLRLMLGATKRRLLGRTRSANVYQPHPNPCQTRFFFSALRDCLEAGQVSEALLLEHIERGYLRCYLFDELNAQTGYQYHLAAVPIPAGP